MNILQNAAVFHLVYFEFVTSKRMSSALDDVHVCDFFQHIVNLTHCMIVNVQEILTNNCIKL